MHTPRKKYVYMHIFKFVGIVVIHANFHVVGIVSQAFLNFFSDIISFQHVPHFGVGISEIEWKLKFQFYHRAKIGYLINRDKLFSKPTMWWEGLVIRLTGVGWVIH